MKIATALHPLQNKDAGELGSTWPDGKTPNLQHAHCFQFFTLPNKRYPPSLQVYFTKRIFYLHWQRTSNAYLMSALAFVVGFAPFITL